jgi:hypothetical protein
MTLGWVGQVLLDSYESERRPVGVRNVEAAGWAATGEPIWRSLVTAEINDDTPQNAALRRRVAASFDVRIGACAARST